VPALVVFMNKVDMVDDPDLLTWLEEENVIRILNFRLSGPTQSPPVIRVSALVCALEGRIPEIGVRDE